MSTFEINNSQINEIEYNKTISATEQQNTNHIYLEQYIDYEHNHDGIDSSKLINPINIGKTTVDDITLTTNMSFVDLVNHWDSGWVNFNTAISASVMNITHGLESIPTMYSVYISTTDPSSSITGLTEQYDTWRIDNTDNRRRHGFMKVSSITTDIISIQYGGVIGTSNNYVDISGEYQIYTAPANCWVRVILIK